MLSTHLLVAQEPVLEDAPAADEPPAAGAEAGGADPPPSDSPAASTGSTAAATTAADPAISADHLDLLLEPLTVEELEAEAQAWRDLVKASVMELAQTSITLQGVNEQEASEEQKATHAGLSDQLADLQDEKAKLLKRFDIVLRHLEKKGGDASTYRVYAQAVSGVKLDVKDTQASMSAIRGWLKSEDGGIKWAFGIVKFVVIMIVFWIISTLFSSVVRRIINRHGRISDLLKRFINKLVRRTILFIGLLVALSTLGVNVGALFALIGGGAFIVGFALQDTLGNFAAGLMLLVYRPFDVGDAVEVGGVSGKVDNVSLVSTTITTFDNKVVLVPNKSVWGQVITNATASAERRVDLVFGIGYNDDADKAQAIMEKIVQDHELVLDTPETVIKLHELADSSVNFICRPWCKTDNYWTVYWDITRRVKAEFDANGISIPFPQRDVHVHQAT